jgi:site-specific recombinase XerD
MLTNQQALQRLQADILLRGLSKSTRRVYTSQVERFLEHCRKPVGELNEVDVRNYLGRMVVEKRHKPKTINLYAAAIRFFFAVTLNRTMNYLQIPRFKVPKKLPEILTQGEVSEIIGKCSNIKHKALLMLAYGSGLRVSELASLKVKDIDSSSMRILIRSGKGKKDRYTILSEKALFALRDYWQKYRPKSPEGFLFPGIKNIGHITPDAITRAIEATIPRTNIKKKVTPHTFRHCFATHLLEDGYSLLQIKEMLGHASLSSTAVYLHLANTTSGITSPADNMPEIFADYPLDCSL